MALCVLVYKIYLHEEFMHAGIIYFYPYIWTSFALINICCVVFPFLQVLLCYFFYFKKLHRKNVLYFSNLLAVMKALIM